MRRCTPAPAPALCRRYKLTCPGDGANSEKRLRALLVRCPEWNDAATRQRLADQLEAEDAAAGCDSGVPALLRARSGAAMRKQHMLCLAHCWRYRADCWSAKGKSGSEGEAAPERKRSRTRPPAAPPAVTQAERHAPCAADDAPGTRLALLPPGSGAHEAAAQPLALRDRTFQSSGMAEAQVMTSLVPLIRGATAAWEGPASSVAYARVGGAGLTWHRVRTVEGALEVTTWLDAVVAQRLRALRAWRDTLGEDAERAPAYTVDAAYNSPESELEAMRSILAQSSASTHTSAAAGARPDGSLLPQDAAWVVDFRAGHAAALGLVATGLAFIAQQRMEPLRAYLDAAEAVLCGMRRYTQASAASLVHRIRWTSATCESLGALAGDRAVAHACVPPLVHRLRLTGDDPEGARLLAMAAAVAPTGQPPQRFALVARDAALSDAAAALMRRQPPLEVPVVEAPMRPLAQPLLQEA